MKITFIMADTWGTEARLRCDNEHVPYKKRTVTINLTDEQLRQIKCRKVGKESDVDKFEEIIDCFIENEKSD